MRATNMGFDFGFRNFDVGFFVFASKSTKPKNHSNQRFKHFLPYKFINLAAAKHNEAGNSIYKNI